MKKVLLIIIVSILTFIGGLFVGVSQSVHLKSVSYKVYELSTGKIYAATNVEVAGPIVYFTDRGTGLEFIVSQPYRIEKEKKEKKE